MRYLVKQLKGTRAVAGALGISQRTVERYIMDQIKRPRTDLAQRLRTPYAPAGSPHPRARPQAGRHQHRHHHRHPRTLRLHRRPCTTDDARLRHLTVRMYVSVLRRGLTHRLTDSGSSMKGFRSAGAAQRFLSAFTGISPHLRRPGDSS
jgi:hypothetical protein